jgi:uncharacterized protein
MLGVFAKFWQPGCVKTRLAAELGDRAAAELARQFLQTTLDRLDGLADRHEVCFTPADRHAEFRAAVPPEWTLSPQAEGDLGRKMEAFFERAFALGAERVVLLGSDTPSVPRENIDHALAALQRALVVLGPVADGGYYLVGARQSPPPIFHDIAWSTPAVWQQTLATLHQAGLHEGVGYALLPPWQDVDTLEDLLALRQELAGCSEVNPLTRLAEAIDRVLGSGG